MWHSLQAAHGYATSQRRLIQSSYPVYSTRSLLGVHTGVYPVWHNAETEGFRTSISRFFKLESFLAIRQERSKVYLFLFPPGLGNFCPATSASFLSLELISCLLPATTKATRLRRCAEMPSQWIIPVCLGWERCVLKLEITEAQTQIMAIQSDYQFPCLNPH